MAIAGVMDIYAMTTFSEYKRFVVRTTLVIDCTLIPGTQRKYGKLLHEHRRRKSDMGDIDIRVSERADLVVVEAVALDQSRTGKSNSEKKQPWSIVWYDKRLSTSWTPEHQSTIDANRIENGKALYPYFPLSPIV